MVTKKTKDSYGDLFIPMHDVSEKRKHLLLSLKNSLIMQEEYEKILVIRAKKSEILTTIKKSKESFGDLFIPMHDVSEKRKHLLLSLKNSLVMQEEYEKILVLRAKKAEVLTTLKKGMTSINSDYLKLKKHFPNVKNVLSNTEKEIAILESQINLLKNSNIKNSDDILKKIEMEKELEKIEKSKVLASQKSNKKTNNKKVYVKKTTPIKSVPKKPLTKKERVKANLKSIESKLNNL